MLGRVAVTRMRFLLESFRSTPNSQLIGCKERCHSVPFHELKRHLDLRNKDIFWSKRVIDV